MRPYCLKRNGRNWSCCITLLNVSPDILDTVVQRYLAIDPILKNTFKVIREGEKLNDISAFYNEYRDQYCASFYDAVQAALILASSHPDFDQLISKACSSGAFHRGLRPAFAEGTHQHIL